ncbi:hypothetical protein Lal_00015648 [Lupinus albus]|nr:hypothetical protein Lal_00015648 [Lupinus albus]
MSSNFWPCTDHLMDHGLNGHCLKGLCPVDRRPPHKHACYAFSLPNSGRLITSSGVDGSTSYNHEAEVIVLEGLLPRMKLDSVLTPSYADLTMKRQKNRFFDSQISGTSEKDWKVRNEVLDRTSRERLGAYLVLVLRRISYFSSL